jgi:hypothetical protein
VAKDANAGLDALDARLLQNELPGIGAAFDRTAMAGHLQAALIGPQRLGRVQRCGLRSAILLDRECVVIRYELEVEDGAGQVRPTLVTCRVYPDAARAAVYEAERLAPLVAAVRGREEVAPCAAPVAVLDPLGMVVHVFPIDGELPTLAAATDPTVAARAIGELLVANGRRDIRVEGARAEPVHYSRRHRCMLRYHLVVEGGRRLVVYGKVANEGSGAHIPAMVDALRVTFAGAGVAVPECLGFSEDLQLVVFTEIPGAPRVAQLLLARLRGEPPGGGLTVEDAVEACGQTAAALHTSALRLGARRPLHAELARLRDNLVPIRRLAPEVAEPLGHWLEVAETLGAATPALDLCQCHGDFSYTQLIFDGPDVGLVDFDSFCQAEPALDLGQFLAYLRYAGVKASSTTAAERARVSERLAERFTTAYTAAGGPAEAVERVAVYEVVSLLRMAEHAWHNLKGRRLDHIVTALGERLPRGG